MSSMPAITFFIKDSSFSEPSSASLYNTLPVSIIGNSADKTPIKSIKVETRLHYTGLGAILLLTDRGANKEVIRQPIRLEC